MSIEGFYTFNVGQGNFHWLRCENCTEKCGGVVFDCGAKFKSPSKGGKIQNAIDTATSIATIQPKLLILSHYHTDHYNGIKELSETSRRLKLAWTLPVVWIPEVDYYSMNMFLRNLSWASLFRIGSKALDEYQLRVRFSYENPLESYVCRHFPNASVQRVHEGAKFKCPAKGKTIAKVLTPPCFPRNNQHPLNTSVQGIVDTLEQQGPDLLSGTLSNRIIGKVRNMIEIASSRKRFVTLLEKQFRYSLNDLKEYQLEEKLINYHSKHPAECNMDEIGDQNTTFRLMLATASNASAAKVKRIPIDHRDIPVVGRKHLGKMKETILEATHLFNISIAYNDPNGQKYLLTGDADKKLWSSIIKNGGLCYNAIQVPHHGSKNNVCEKAYMKLDCPTYIVSSDKTYFWSHPSKKLVDVLLKKKKSTSISLFCTNCHQNCEVKKRGSAIECHDYIIVNSLSIMTKPNITNPAKGSCPNL